MSTAIAIRDIDHKKGPESASLHLIHYGDFECPISKGVVRLVNKLIDANDQEVCFVYRYFPLQNIHPHAQMSAEVAESAASQGKFWDMVAMLYKNQRHLEKSDLLGYAGELGLDTASIEHDLEESVYHDRIRNDKRMGVLQGVRTTGGLIVNGEIHQGKDNLPGLLRDLLKKIKA